MHERLFANQRSLSPPDLIHHAEALGLEVPRFQQCLDSGKYASRIRQDIEEGSKAGVTGTPSFFLGLTEPNGSEVKALRALRGAQPYPQFKEAIESLLTAQKK